ncbi:MAG: tetratricopeptide repeat protein [Candidatus Heimdallarchaeota archaeon]
MSFTFLTDSLDWIKERFGLDRNRQALTQIDSLIQQGNHDQALARIEELFLKENIPPRIQIENKLLKCEILLEKGENTECGELARETKKAAEQNELMVLQKKAVIMEANALIGLGQINESLELIKDMEAEEISNNEVKAQLLRVKGIAMRRKGELDPALEHLSEALVIYQRLKKKNFPIAGLYNTIGIIHASKGSLDKASEFLQLSLSKYEELGNERPAFKIMNNLGMMHSYRGDLDRALQYLNRALELNEEYGSPQTEAAMFSNIGNIYIGKGELTLALDYIQRALKRYEELESKVDIGDALNNLGNIYEEIGDLKEAESAYTRCLEIYQDLENDLEISLVMNNLGNIYTVGGELDKSISYYEKALALSESVGSTLDIVHSLRNLIEASIQNGQMDEAQEYLQKLGEIAKGEDNKTIDQGHRLSNAILLKASDRMVERAEAQEIFQQIAEEEVVEHQYTVQSMLNLCDLLLDELKSSGSEEVVEEINSLLARLLEIAESQNSFKHLINTQRLQSQMALLELDLNKARQLMAQAQETAEEKGLHRLAIAISADIDRLMNQLNKWEDLIERNVGMVERLEMAELEDMVSNIIQKKQEIPEFTVEEPVLFLMLSNTGAVHFKKELTSKEDLDDRIIGDLLTAINSFVQEAFSASGVIERIRVKDYTLIIKPLVEQILCCFVFKGQSYSAVQKLEKFIQTTKDSSFIWDIVKQTSKAKKAVKTLDDLSTEIFMSPISQEA